MVTILIIVVHQPYTKLMRFIDQENLSSLKKVNRTYLNPIKLYKIINN